ncbi:MAG: hypothetical protein LAN63_11475 [Acidobacteriia bacterium]|nr:hypothetical protein [Terriglobia bacterium]
MPANSEERKRWSAGRAAPNTEVRSHFQQRLFLALGLIALLYAFLAGLRTVTDFDLGWQLATGRWVAQHHQIPSTDVFSYTAQGQPWIYPVGSGLVFYAAYLLGGWALLSWLGAAVCTGTAALLLRRGSVITAALAILVIPRIALHTTPRADMFTVLLFAWFLTLLWEHHETGGARLWLLPVLMIAWVNLHLGFAAGLALLGGYALIEALELLWRERRHAAAERLRRAWPWLVATIGATLVNPWGWGVYRALLRQNAAMAEHSQWIIEWAPARLSWTLVTSGLSFRNPGGAFYLMLLIAAVAVPLALLRRQLGAAMLLGGAALLSVRHIRFQALFAVVVVIVAGAVLTAALSSIQSRLGDARLRSMLAIGATVVVALLACVRSFDLVTDRSYLGTTELGSFGTGLSWWFPEGAAAFIERENIPVQIFNSYNEGGYLSWRLGPKYRDYIDGRAIPFGPDLFQRNGTLLLTPPNSPEWQSEAERYGISAMIVPLARYNALQFFPVLRQFCASDAWRPVYLDEVSAVFVRVTPQTEKLIQRLQIDCRTAPLPATVPEGGSSKAFNQWANAAAVLNALGRNSEAFAATTRALMIFPDSAFVHFLRATLLQESGNVDDAEKQYLAAAALEANAATWSALADVYHAQHRLEAEIQAREQAAEYLPRPGVALLRLGYAYLDARRPQEALRAFDRAQSSLPSQPTAIDNSFMANLAHGRAMAWSALGRLDRAVSFEEETVRLSPDRAEDWLQLADWYIRQGRLADGQRARDRAAAVQASQLPSNSR